MQVGLICDPNRDYDVNNRSIFDTSIQTVLVENSQSMNENVFIKNNRMLFDMIQTVLMRTIDR